MFAIILSILLLAVIIVLLYDFVPSFLNWFGRIKIGTVTDDNEWLVNIEDRAIQWMTKKTPSVPKRENERLLLIRQIKKVNKESPICCWQDSALLKGISGINADEAADASYALAERYIDIATGEWKKQPENIDAAILAYELMSCGSISSSTIEPAMNFIADMLLDKYKKYGTVPYNDSIADIRFVDTVGMICPFLIKYANVYGKPEFIDIALEQIKQYRKFGFDEQTKLPFHCFNADTHAKLGICGWGRGCGWWAIGIADSLKELLECDGMNKEKVVFLKLNMEFLETAEKYINENGSVNRMMLNESLPDSSAAAMLAYSFAYMYSLTQKDSYKKSVLNILSYLKTVTRRNGVIDFSQGDTMGIGYYSSELSVVPTAQGFAIAAANMINR